MNRVQIIQGHVLEVLKGMADESVQCCVTSPPYWGLRDYGIEGQVWGGEEGCGHEWGDEEPQDSRHRWTSENSGTKHTAANEYPKGRGNFCRLCGAWKGSYGLEPTPELYIEHTLEIFREVRRVLRKDGTLWLNLGDSYAGGGRAGKDGIQKWGGIESGNQNRKYGPPVNTPGLKSKDLCGIPWRVALALQQPYYTGKIKNKKDRIWLAAMIDGEGCMFIHKRKVGQNNGQGYVRKNDSYGAGLEVANTHKEIVDRCLAITGLGSICCVERETKTKKRNIPLYRWNLRSNQCREVIKEIYPYLVGKQHEARLILGCPSSGSDAEKAHVSLIALHNGKDASIDFPAPTSMWEPGWYLRSDIIWSKKNPMPESCTDRPTKAHEYIFLLTKSARYYYDQEAVREESKVAPEDRMARAGKIVGNEYHKSGVVQGRPLGKKSFVNWVNSNQGRNLRTVWDIATVPFSDWFETVHQAHVERDVVSCGMKHKVSPDCPVHGCLCRQDSIPPDDEHEGDYLTRNGRNGNCLSQERLFDCEPIGLPHGEDSWEHNWDSPPPMYFPFAKDHSKQSRKKGHAPVTNSPCISSGETASCIGDKSIQPGCAANHPGISGCIPLPDEKDVHLPGQIPDRIVDKSSLPIPPECLCSFYQEETKKSSHFAVFPPAIPERCIKAGTSEKGCCSKCGAPWVRVVEKGKVVCVGGSNKDSRAKKEMSEYGPMERRKADGSNCSQYATQFKQHEHITTGWQPSCSCCLPKDGCTGSELLRYLPMPCTVLDPFSGAATTLMVAAKLGRNAIGIELNQEYVAMSVNRLKKELGLWCEIITR